MKTIKQINIDNIDVVSNPDHITLSQTNKGEPINHIDVVLIEKQSIPALIEALKKYVE